MSTRTVFQTQDLWQQPNQAFNPAVTPPPINQSPTAGFTPTPNANAYIEQRQGEQQLYSSPANASPFTQQRIGEKDLRTGLDVDENYTNEWILANQMQALANGADISNMPKADQEALANLLGVSLSELRGNDGTVSTKNNTGAAPFGTNAQGQRLDVYGNVWNPDTAQRDIYGGQFRQPGETRWAKNRRGRTVKQVLTKGNKWVTVKSRKRSQAQDQDTQQESMTTGSFGVVSFNVGVG